MDPETMPTQDTLDEAFDDIIVLESQPRDSDDDWMAGEFDIA